MSSSLIFTCVVKVYHAVNTFLP